MYRSHIKVKNVSCDVSSQNTSQIPNILPDLREYQLSEKQIIVNETVYSLYERLINKSLQPVTFRTNTTEYHDFYCEQVNLTCIPKEFVVQGVNPFPFSPEFQSLHRLTFKYYTEDISNYTFTIPEQCNHILNAKRSKIKQISHSREGKEGNAESIDYRAKGVISEVYDEDNCNSSYVFALKDMIQSRQSILREFNNKSFYVDAQKLLNCLFTDEQVLNNNGCTAGYNYASMRKLIFDLNGRLPQERSQYESYEEKCDWANWKKKVYYTTFEKISPKVSAIQSELIEKGPLIAEMSVCDSFYSYSGGVYENYECQDSAVEESVLIVGFGKDTKYGEYWILKNSFGSQWGSGGYMYLSAIGNQCNIMDEVYSLSKSVNISAIMALVCMMILIIAATLVILAFCLKQQNKQLSISEEEPLLYDDKELENN